jgi:molecular chaperone GrpE
MLKRKKKMQAKDIENQEENLQEASNTTDENLDKEQTKDNKEQTETDKIEDLGNKLEEINDKYLRLYSDFENFRKRTAKDKVDMIKFASQETIKDLLPIVDDYERALEDFNSQEQIPQTSKEGLELIYNKLMTTLKQKGVEPIIAKGEQFDENLHEAISQFPATDEAQKGIIIEEVLKGYKMYDRVIRFSKVVVAI